MDMQKPSLPKGTRDFGPVQMQKRSYLLGIIKEVFVKFGFQPLETPAMENLSVLTGKYGDEGDQLLFRILNSGDYLSKATPEDAASGSAVLLPKITEKGLRYDLTVPFARYVVMNRNEVHLPFKRYQVQPVWRADRPQKGRYREFFQCDADVVGTDSLLCEAEIIAMITEVYARLGIMDYHLTFSSRKILNALANYLGAPEKFTSICVAIDKLDKIGVEKVLEELATQAGLSADALEKAAAFLETKGDNAMLLEAMNTLLGQEEEAIKGLEEIREIFKWVEGMGISTDKLVFDPKLARGLNYYTGAIFEVKPTSVEMGTLTAGGRYDNLTGIFGMPGLSGVGISFGVDRLYDVMETLGLFPEKAADSTRVLLVNFDAENALRSLPLLRQLRDAGIAAELYPDAVKLKKQFTYAENKGIPYLLMAGSEEHQKGLYGLKDLSTGEQEALDVEGLVAKLC
jgi:histidyl-tRNA synthetase